MAGLPARWFGGDASLGPWICLPLLAFLLVGIAATQVPVPDCLGAGTGAGSDDGEPVAIMVSLAGVASLLALGGAVQRLLALRRAGAFSLRRDGTIGAVVAIALLLATAVPASRRGDLGAGLEGLFLAGLALAVLALLLLLVAWAARRRLDGVGVLVPAYLIGAGVFAYPLVAFLGLVSSSGVFC
jgi:hypothetical protein